MNSNAHNLNVDIYGYRQVHPSLWNESMKFYADEKYHPFITKLEDLRVAEIDFFLKASNQSGYWINRFTNELGGLFGRNGNGKLAILSAIHKNDRLTLTCFGPFLPRLYERFGFVKGDFDKWNDNYAPDNWNYEKYGTPNVWYMKFNSVLFKDCVVERFS